jgi:putative oxidoreductase
VLIAAIWCLATAAVASFNFGDLNQINHLMKNVGLTAGCLTLAGAGAGRYSIDFRGS